MFKISASKGIVFSYPDHKPSEMICVKNLPAPWSSGSVYLTNEQAIELKTALDKAINGGNGLIFD